MTGLRRKPALTIIRRAQRELGELLRSIDREYPVGMEGEYPAQWQRVAAELKEALASLHCAGLPIDNEGRG